jgi:hypothetical protein
MEKLHNSIFYIEKAINLCESNLNALKEIFKEEKEVESLCTYYKEKLVKLKKELSILKSIK